MKTKALILTLGLFTVCTATALAQIGTLTKPGTTYEDPKATDNNSKVLIDTSTTVIDSLLDDKKESRKKFPQHNANPTSNKEKPVNMRVVPVDTARLAKP